MTLFSLQFSVIQTLLVQRISKSLSETLGSTVEVGSIDIGFFDKTLVLQEVYIADHHNDTLIYAQYLKTNLAYYDFQNLKLDFGSLEINNGKFFIRQYRGESEMNLFVWIDKLVTDTTPTPTTPFVITCKNVNLKGLSFINLDENEPITPSNEINYFDLNVRHINISVSDFSVDQNNSYKGVMNFLQAKEKCGADIKHLSGIVSVDSTQLKMKNLIAKVNNSKINCELEFNYKKYPDWFDFNEQIKLNTKINSSFIRFTDIAYFAPALSDFNDEATIKGKVTDNINALKGKDVIVKFGKSSQLVTDFKFKSLAEPNNTNINVVVKNLNTNNQDLINLSFLKENLSPLIAKQITELGQLTYAGNVSGTYDNLLITGNIGTDLGTIGSDINLKGALNEKEIGYSGKIVSNNFNIGKLTKIGNLGFIDLNLTFIGKGTNEKTLSANLVGNINQVNFNKFNYKGILLEGSYDKQIVKSNLVINQPEISLEAKGQIDFSKSIPSYNFIANTKKIDFVALHFTKQDSLFNAKGSIVCDFKANSIDDIKGNFDLSNLTINRNKAKLNLDWLNINTNISEGYRTATISSNLINGELKGNFNITEVSESLAKQFQQLVPAMLSKENSTQNKSSYKNQRLDYTFTLNNSNKLLDVFYPDLQISTNSTIKGDYDTKSETLRLLLNSKEVKLNNNKYANFYANANLEGGLLDFTLGTTRLTFSDSVWIDDLNFMGSAFNDTLTFNLDWKNRNSNRYKGEIIGQVALSPLPNIHLKINPSEITIADSLFKIDASSLLVIKDTIIINDFQIHDNKQYIKINGKASNRSKDKLAIDIKNLNLSTFNVLTPKNINLFGFANGSLDISDIYKTPIIQGNFEVTNMAVNNYKYDKLLLKAKWNDDKKLINLTSSLSSKTEENFRITGSFSPFDKVNQYDLTVDMREFLLAPLNLYENDFYEKVEGKLSGNLAISGMFEKPEINGKIKLHNTYFTNKLFNTRYSVNNEINVSNNKFIFNNIFLQDTLGNKGYLTGNVTHNNFKDFNLDLKIKATNILAINTTEESPEMYYGTVFATGTVTLKGLIDELAITVNAKSEPGTKVNIPIKDDSDAGAGNFVTFINKADTTTKVIEQKELKGISFSANLDITPDAELQVIFDPKVGDVLKGTGQGVLSMELSPLGDFKMFGDVEIEKGTYLFTLQNLVNKRFEIEKGGRVTWTGEPLGGKLDIATIYKLKASPKDLFAGTVDSNYTKKIPVDVKLLLKDKMLNPTINFDIDFPDVDPELAQKAKTIINNSRDVNKQVFSLLMINQFSSPSANSGIVSSGVSSSTSELLSNQVSQLLSQFSDAVDIGVKYQSGTQTSKDVVEVGVSTQLFNDRLKVDGTVANNGSANSSGASAIVGDFNVDYKLSKDGRTKIKAFQRSNQFDLLDQSSQFTRGIGVSYSKLFNKFTDLFKNKKKTTDNLTE